jgi:hypothetical protein
VKSNEARELMVERVQAAKAKWPTLWDMPVAFGDYNVVVDPNLLVVDPDQAYVKALYAAAYRGEPVGLSDNLTIAVCKVAEKPI